MVRPHKSPVITIVLLACFFYPEIVKAAGGFSVSDFNPLSNVKLPADKVIKVDLDSAVTQGIRVPTRRQCSDQAFQFTFHIQSASSQALYYKIYYQNEEYAAGKDPSGHGTSSRNFYGSWGEEESGFKMVPPGEMLIKDQFKIVGNPRNEKRFFGQPMEAYALSDSAIKLEMSAIQASPDWMKAVKSKALKQNIPLEQQVELDAIYSLCFKRDQGQINHRWKRNPPMGRYSVMLVVCSSHDWMKLPAYISDITEKKGNDFANPYSYFLNGPGKQLNETVVVVDTFAFVLHASIDLSKGIYIDNSTRPAPHDYSALNPVCNNGRWLYYNAQVEQFFSAENRSHTLRSIPEIKDIPGNEFTLKEYEQAKVKYDKEDLLSDYVRSSGCPCKTIRYDSIGKQIEIRNPGSEAIKTAVKENAGLRSRIGFTYGTFTAKIAFPPLLNDSNLWTGVSNSFWLMFQDKQPWNNRSESVSGYIEKGSFSPDAPRKSTTYYAEIDLELTKASKFWPKEVYFGQNGPVESTYGDRSIIAALSNWDMANQDPPRFAKGFCPVFNNHKEYRPFRWEYYHQALTDRVGLKHDEVFGQEFYYYQLVWTPTSITWRIGPSRDRMNVIGYMDASVTSIPDNQMLMVVSQEYHLSEWLPPMPYKQEYLPFLKNDLVGKIAELTIE